ncbi:hypothetical protein KUTeg_016888 [Tegillarca granosa]|uniref:Adenylate kinase 3 n=1 Tax=Tegillarca granosa TaxID=220873 RepID=A0ABQ9EST5_TEGGR|nr:hypothetical protein KUTeg_016888 [Tegillarca granosa]
MSKLKVLRAIIMGPPGSGKGTISTRIIKDFKMRHLSSGDLLRSHIVNETSLGLKAKEYIDKGKFVPDETMTDLILNELGQLPKDQSWLLDGFPRTLPQAEALYKSQPVDVVVDLNVPFKVIIERIEGRWTHAPSGRIYHNIFHRPKIEPVKIKTEKDDQATSNDTETPPPPLPNLELDTENDTPVNAAIIKSEQSREVPDHSPEKRRKKSSAFSELFGEGKDDITGEDLIQREDDKPETVKKRLEEYQNLTKPVLEFYRNHGLLAQFTGKYSNEIWPEVHKYLSTKMEPQQYTHYG